MTDKKRFVIFDTDWWTDCDDCVALKLLLKDENTVIKGININAFMDCSPYSVELFVKNCTGENISIAIDKNATDYGDKPTCGYQHKLIEHFSRGVCKSADNYENSVSFYRKILSTAEEKIDIVSVGFQNSIADLLLSESDEISPMNGYELCKSKVGKIWAMAGKWNEQGGKEYNVANTARSVKAAQTLARDFPCPITYLGFEAGESVLTGGSDVLKDENDPLFVSMKAYGALKGRASWDPMTALLAINGNAKKAGYDTVAVKIEFDENGGNYFTSSSSSDRCYVVKKMPDSFYAEQIKKRISVDKTAWE